jgi:hypothetical protein
MVTRRHALQSEIADYTGDASPLSRLGKIGDSGHAQDILERTATRAGGRSNVKRDAVQRLPTNG